MKTFYGKSLNDANNVRLENFRKFCTIIIKFIFKIMIIIYDYYLL